LTATNQYRPVTSSETGIGAALTPRFFRTMADNISNYVLYVGSHKLIAQLCAPQWCSLVNAEADQECAIWTSAGRHLPDGYTKALVIAHHHKAAGDGDVDWRLYSHTTPYDGSYIVTDAPSDTYIEWASSILYSQRYATPAGSELPIAAGPDGLVYFTLTAKSASGSAAAAVTSLDAWPCAVTTQAAFADTGL
jgi:hypothetical protein